MQDAAGIYASLPDVLCSLSASIAFHHFGLCSARCVPAHRVACGTFSSLPRAEPPCAGVLQDLAFPILSVVSQVHLPSYQPPLLLPPTYAGHETVGQMLHSLSFIAVGILDKPFLAAEQILHLIETYLC